MLDPEENEEVPEGKGGIRIAKRYLIRSLEVIGGFVWAVVV